MYATMAGYTVRMHRCHHNKYWLVDATESFADICEFPTPPSSPGSSATFNVAENSNNQHRGIRIVTVPAEWMAKVSASYISHLVGTIIPSYHPAMSIEVTVADIPAKLELCAHGHFSFVKSGDPLVCSNRDHSPTSEDASQSTTSDLPTDPEPVKNGAMNIDDDNEDSNDDDDDDVTSPHFLLPEDQVPSIYNEIEVYAPQSPANEDQEPTIDDEIELISPKSPPVEDQGPTIND